MTDMKRMSIAFPDEVVEAIERLKATEEFKRATYSEIVRVLVKRGLAKPLEEKNV